MTFYLKNYRGSGSQRFIAFAATLPHPLQMNFAGLTSAFTSSYFALFFIISQMWLSCPSCGIVFTLIITKSKAYKQTLCVCSMGAFQEHSQIIGPGLSIFIPTFKHGNYLKSNQFINQYYLISSSSMLRFIKFIYRT